MRMHHIGAILALLVVAEALLVGFSVMHRAEQSAALDIVPRLQTIQGLR